MVIELINGNGYRLSISTRDAKLAAEWFREYIPDMLATPVHYGGWRIQFYPTDEKEIGTYTQMVRTFDHALFAQDLIAIADHLTKGRS